MNAEGCDAAQRVEQFAFRDLVHAARDKRVVAGLQRLREILIREHERLRRRLWIEPIGPFARGPQTIAQGAQHCAIGFALGLTCSA